MSNQDSDQSHKRIYFGSCQEEFFEFIKASFPNPWIESIHAGHGEAENMEEVLKVAFYSGIGMAVKRIMAGIRKNNNGYAACKAILIECENFFRPEEKPEGYDNESRCLAPGEHGDES